MWLFFGVTTVPTLFLAAAITERKQAEQAAKHARDIAEAAESAARAKSALLANMSHEIRTPIHGMLGITSLVLDTQLDPQQHEYAELLRRSGDALLTLVNDTLDVAKIEAGKLSLERIDFDLPAMIEDVIELLSQEAHGKGVELACVVHADVPAWVAGDPNRLRQVVTNLVGNAVKFTDAGEVVVRVESAHESPRELMLRVTVKDTGIGIPREAQLRIFDAFAQADLSTTRRFGGTGLGLTICKELVELMGGSIGFASEPGQGSTFWFNVPVLRPQALHEQALARLAALRGVRVLCVADHAALREALEQDLVAMGMQADCVDSSARALVRLQGAAQEGTPHELAVIDLHMAGDIIEMVRDIRADPALEHIRSRAHGLPDAGDGWPERHGRDSRPRGRARQAHSHSSA